MSPGALERKICNSSVEPPPSRIPTPKRDFQLLPTDSGSASPAEVQMRKREPQRSFFWVSPFSIAENKVGTPKKILGLYFFISANITAGVGRSELRTVAEPTDIGNVRALPRPEAQNRFAADRPTSSSRMPRTCRA